MPPCPYANHDPNHRCLLVDLGLTISDIPIHNCATRPSRESQRFKIHPTGIRHYGASDWAPRIPGTSPWPVTSAGDTTSIRRLPPGVIVIAMRFTWP